jgi:hypothetical protein
MDHFYVSVYSRGSNRHSFGTLCTSEQVHHHIPAEEAGGVFISNQTGEVLFCPGTPDSL